MDAVTPISALPSAPALSDADMIPIDAVAADGTTVTSKITLGELRAFLTTPAE